MALEIEMTGSGSVGPLEPGWTVNEYATPVAPGERAGGTGNVGMSAASRAESQLILNNRITSTHERLGSIPGVVRTVSKSGITTSFTHDTVLSKLDADRYMPPIIQGSGWAAIDLALQVIGENRLNLGS